MHVASGLTRKLTNRRFSVAKAVRKSNGHDPAPASDTSAPTENINFHKAVIEGKEILAKIEEAKRGQLRLGELADQLETQYGERTLAKFAKELDIAPCTLARYRDVYRDWDGAGIRTPGRVSYAVLRELAPHASKPECQEAIRANPNITERTAQDLKRKLDSAGKEKAQETKEAADAAEALRETKKWFGDLVIDANKIRGLADVTEHCTTDEQWCRLLDNVERQQLADIRRTGNTLVRLADQLEYLSDKQVTEDFASHLAQWRQERERERVAKSDLKERKRSAKTTPKAQKAISAQAAMA